MGSTPAEVTIDTRRFRDCLHEKQKIRRRLHCRDGEFFDPDCRHYLAEERAPLCRRCTIEQARHIAEQSYRAFYIELARLLWCGLVELALQPLPAPPSKCAGCGEPLTPARN